MKTTKHVLGALAVLGTLATTTAAMAWQPSKPVEFIVTAGAGGGTDIFARSVQAAIQKNNLMSQPIIVTIKGGGSGAEGYVYTKLAEGDSHKVVFGTHNMYVLPLAAKVAFTHNDLTPIAAMAFDEFMLWVKGDSPIKSVKDFVAAAKAKPDGLRMAGAQSKDSDELVTLLTAKATGIKLTYIPFKSGGEADVQLSGGHVDGHMNNPSESTGNWKAGKVRPLCVFNTQKLSGTDKVTETQSWSDIPTCKAEGIGLDAFTQPRIASLPGKQPADVVAFYTDLMKKVAETAEFKDYLKRTAQSGNTQTGDGLKAFIAKDYDRFKTTFTEQGWLAK